MKSETWQNVVVSVVTFITDNFLLLLALGWIALGEIYIGLAIMAVAYYQRLTEIRDRISDVKVTVIIEKQLQSGSVQSQK